MVVLVELVHCQPYGFGIPDEVLNRLLRTPATLHLKVDRRRGVRKAFRVQLGGLFYQPVDDVFEALARKANGERNSPLQRLHHLRDGCYFGVGCVVGYDEGESAPALAQSEQGAVFWEHDGDHAQRVLVSERNLLALGTVDGLEVVAALVSQGNLLPLRKRLWVARGHRLHHQNLVQNTGGVRQVGTKPRTPKVRLHTGHHGLHREFRREDAQSLVHSPQNILVLPVLLCAAFEQVPYRVVHAIHCDRIWVGFHFSQHRRLRRWTSCSFVQLFIRGGGIRVLTVLHARRLFWIRGSVFVVKHVPQHNVHAGEGGCDVRVGVPDGLLEQSKVAGDALRLLSERLPPLGRILQDILHVLAHVGEKGLELAHGTPKRRENVARPVELLVLLQHRFEFLNANTCVHGGRHVEAAQCLLRVHRRRLRAFVVPSGLVRQESRHGPRRAYQPKHSGGVLRLFAIDTRHTKRLVLLLRNTKQSAGQWLLRRRSVFTVVIESLRRA
mmetsp:Transcript_32245/g.60587  ORF Transcript_32245/g.60587 Transcript_32245/m.60587 type:complete len:497 (-) Transcript_32245:29-1519(-)